MKNKHLPKLIIALLVAIFYANTLSLDYALDDRMVILESKYTIKGGWDSVKSIFTEDTFKGYFGSENNVVAGGRYRPMSQLTFMIEFQLFGQDIKSHLGDVDDYMNLHDSDHEKYFKDSTLAVVNHLMNVLYFMLLCLIVYEVLAMLFTKYQGTKWYQSLAFVATVLFALHPIHTEAVANVKGRDEIFAMLGAMAALWCALKYVDKRSWWLLLLELLAITFGLFSKENTITFLAVVPLALYFYPKEKKRMDYLLTLLPIVVGSVFFIVVRSNVLGGFMPEDTTHNILNNPYIHSTKVQEVATVLLTWGIYFKLLVFPHPLTHDYYPHQIAITDFSNPLVWVVVVGCVALLVLALRGLKKKTVVSFAILFFVITFSITSNLLFNVGTFMNERFVFIPSLGFVLVIAYLLCQLAEQKPQLMRKLSLGVFLLISILYGVKTFTRNFVWNDDFTLFLTDVKTSDNSIKCNISAGGSELQIWKVHHKERDKNAAYAYLQKALDLEKNSLNAYLLLGELMFWDDNPQGAYQAYRNAALIDPRNQIAQDNLRKMALAVEDADLKPITNLLDEAMNERNAAKVMQSYQLINEYLDEHPESLVGLNIKGNVVGRGMGNLDASIAIYEEVLSKDSTFASSWENMGIAYAIKRNFDKAEYCLKKALHFAPDNENIKQNLQMMQRDRQSGN